jgi:protein-S-isoprenylcysteine O-methyltransferase Ste14
MNKLTPILIFLASFLISHVSSAQQPEMADTMRSEGKIYVVVAILLIIFAGLIAYLVMIDRKVTRIEKKLPEKKV